MHVCMYVCIYVYMYVCMHVCMYVGVSYNNLLENFTHSFLYLFLSSFSLFIYLSINEFINWFTYIWIYLIFSTFYINFSLQGSDDGKRWKNSFLLKYSIIHAQLSSHVFNATKHDGTATTNAKTNGRARSWYKKFSIISNFNFNSFRECDPRTRTSNDEWGVVRSR